MSTADLKTSESLGSTLTESDDHINDDNTEALLKYSDDGPERDFPQSPSADDIEALPASNRHSTWAPRAEGSNAAWTVAFNMVNATVGAGVIGLPFALRNAGFGLGLILSFIVGVFTYLSLCLLIHTGRMTSVFRYTSLAQHTLGQRNGLVFVNTPLVK